MTVFREQRPSNANPRGSGARRSPSFRAAVVWALFWLASSAPAAFAWQESNDADRTDASTAEPASDGIRPRSGEPAQAIPSFGLPSLNSTDGIASIPSRLSEMFIAGGIVMWPIAGCSIVALAFAIERLVVLRRRRVIPRDFVTRFLEHLEQRQLDRTGAIELCERNGSPIAEVFLNGVRKWGKPSVEIEQAIIDGGERQVGRLRRHLRILNAVATITPLLGLLGTVFGMIMCFNQIATSSAMGKSEQLAGGIGVALLTTAFGLTVAIPALIIYMYFAGRIDALVMEMDSVAQEVVDLISAEALAEPAAAPQRSAPPRPKGMATAAPGKNG